MTPDRKGRPASGYDREIQNITDLFRLHSVISIIFGKYLL